MESTESNRTDIKLAPAELKDVFGVSIQAITKQIKKLELDTININNRNYLVPAATRKLFEERGYAYPSKVVSFQIVKGGAGKSSLSYSLAIRANQLGARVLCIDIDQQGNLTQALGVGDDDIEYSMVDVIDKEVDAGFKDSIIKLSDSLHVLPSNMNNSMLDHILQLKRMPLDKVFKNLIASVRGDYDLIIFDCPPAINSPNIAAALASDEIIMPVNPDRFTMDGLKFTTEYINDLNEQHGVSLKTKIVYNKFDQRKTASREFLGQLYAHEVYKNLMYKTIIKESVELTNSINQQTSVFSTNKKTALREDLDNFAREVLEMDQLAPETVQ